MEYHNEIFDDFFFDAWDYVSEKVVDDDFWNKNQPLIRETTFDIYNFSKNKNMGAKEAGKILECIFYNIIRHGVDNSKDEQVYI